MGKIWSINPSLAITHKTDFSSSSISFNAITNHAFSRIEDYVNALIERDISYYCRYSGTSPYGHLTSRKTSQLQQPWLSPKLSSTVQITPCNTVTSPLRSLLPSPVGDLNSEVPLYI